MHSVLQSTVEKQVLEPVRSLVVFSDDWGRHPSSCQHLIRQLLPDYKVVWINTIGTRSPRLNLATLTRAVGKLRQWLTSSRSVANQDTQVVPRPQVISPLMWPWFRSRFDRGLNQRLLSRAINNALSQAPRPRVAITTIPLTADLVGALDVDAWIYYCVDDLASWPGLDAKPLQQMEKELVQKVDAVVSVSTHLQQRLAGLGCSSTLISHGVDLAHWHTQAPTTSIEQLLSGAEGPRIVFWGLIDDRLEAEWVLSLADRLTSGSVILAGPVESLPEPLRTHPRIHVVGPLPYDNLPSLAKCASVLIMPYRDIEATRAMQPLKLKEYLATGLPCVVRQLPATERWSDGLDLATTSEEFVAAVINRLDNSLPAAQLAARERLAEESWDAKASAFRAVVDQLVEGIAE